MGSFFDKPTHPRAHKQHQCIACLAEIPSRERYVQQTGFHEGKAFRNRYHNECWDYLNKEGDFEFVPGSVDPPERPNV